MPTRGTIHIVLSPIIVRGNNSANCILAHLDGLIHAMLASQQLARLRGGAARLNEGNSDGETPLHIAAGHPRHSDSVCVALVTELLERLADPSQQDNEGCTALHKAAQQRHVGVMRLLLTHSPHLISIPNRAGKTAMDIVYIRPSTPISLGPSHPSPTHPAAPTHPPCPTHPWPYNILPAPPIGIPRLSPAKGPVMPHVTARPTTYLIVSPQACPNPRLEPAHVRQMQQQAASPPQPNSQLLQACAVLQNKPMFQQQQQQQQQQYQLQQQQLPHLQPASQWGYAANAVQGPGSGTPGTSSPDSARLLSHYPNLTSKFALPQGTGLASPASNPSPLASPGASQVAQGPPGTPPPYAQPHRATTAPASTLLATTDADSPLQWQPEGLPPWLSLPCAPHTPTHQPQAGFRAVQPMAGLLAEMPKMGAGTGGEQGDVQGPGSSPWQQQIPRQQRQQQQQQPPPPPPSHQQQLPHQAQVESQPLQTSESLSSCLTMGNEYTLEQLEEATNNFSEANRLGQGGFAVVYYGYLQQLHVAVKKPSTKLDPESIRHFKVESNVLSTINHPNIIPLIGTCPEEFLVNALNLRQGPPAPGVGLERSLCRHISASSSEHSNLRALAVSHAAALAKAKTPVADLVQPATRAAAPAWPATPTADLVRPATPNADLTEAKQLPRPTRPTLRDSRIFTIESLSMEHFIVLVNLAQQIVGCVIGTDATDHEAGILVYKLAPLGSLHDNLFGADQGPGDYSLMCPATAGAPPHAGSSAGASSPVVALARRKHPPLTWKQCIKAGGLQAGVVQFGIGSATAPSVQADAVEDDAAVQASDLEAALLARPVHKPLPGMMVAMEDSPLLTEQVAGSDVQSMIAGEQCSSVNSSNANSSSANTGSANTGSGDNSSNDDGSASSEGWGVGKLSAGAAWPRQPHNILLSENKKGPVGMLGDVGLTKLVKKKTNGNDPSRLAGTLGYVPPECLDEVTGKWDIYALGIVLLQLVSKDRLVKGGQLRKAMMAAYNADAATFIQAIDPRWADAPDAAKQLMALALNCTEKDPACRPTAEELATALLEMKRGASISTTSASSGSQGRTFTSMWVAVLIAKLMALFESV
ncbi:hypothetical protein QJQ45_007140 [Haematococcus lacustris]|nr:hypothetical protein QJQ45_007140 [Haematococcus lacustris]